MIREKQSTTLLFRRADLIALAFLASFFVFNLIGTWQRWTHPLIDHGREMNLPARILAGEQLYKDVQFLYGPFAPYFNAQLYRTFGIHLSTLHASGAVCAALILLMIYWLARQLMGVWEAWLAAGMVLVFCAIKTTGNYIQPYSYAADYGLVFSLAALICTARYLLANHTLWFFLAGVCTGLALITKQELAAAALAAALVALLLNSLSARKPRWRDAALYILPTIFIAITAYGYILNRVSWRTLLDKNHVFFTNLPPQLIYFNRHVSGVLYLPKSFWYMLTGLGMFALWVGLSMLIGGLVSWRLKVGWKMVAKRAAVLMLGGFAWWKIVLELFRVHTDATPLTAAPVVLMLVIGALCRQVFHNRHKFERVPYTHRLLLVLAVFGLVSVIRVFLNISGGGPYIPFFVPTILIVYLHLMFYVLPAYLAPEGPIRLNIRRTAMAMIIIVVFLVSKESLYRFRHFNTYEISTPRGRMLTEPAIGHPIAEAIRYAREHTSPEDYVLVLPQGSLINFLAERRNPFRQEIIHPGFLEGQNEEEARRWILSGRIPLILIDNVLSPEMRDVAFGFDYNRDLLRFIQEHYHLTATFGPVSGREARLGDKEFFILAYARNP
jgi:4-amino-4-deoxy-L-arabinose transferase-like glycosyltransferase